VCNALDSGMSFLPVTNPTTTKNNLAASAPPSATDNAKFGYSPSLR
jgi:hypothetical protein